MRPASVVVENKDILRTRWRSGELLDLCDEFCGGLGEMVSVGYKGLSFESPPRIKIAAYFWKRRRRWRIDVKLAVTRMLIIFPAYLIPKKTAYSVVAGLRLLFWLRKRAAVTNL